MKNILFLFLIATLSACGQSSETATTTTVGKDFKVKNVVPAEELSDMVSANSSKEVTVKGKINSCCQKKGCWMNMDIGDGKEMKVTFKDYGFFVPKDCSGKTATMKGVASYETISVDVLKHYAEDAGKSQEEIDAITEPELQLVFEATGVKIE